MQNPSDDALIQCLKYAFLLCYFHRTASKFVNLEHIQYPKPNFAHTSSLKLIHAAAEGMEHHNSGHHHRRPTSCECHYLAGDPEGLKSRAVQYLCQIRAGNVPSHSACGSI